MYYEGIIGTIIITTVQCRLNMITGPEVHTKV